MKGMSTVLNDKQSIASCATPQKTGDRESTLRGKTDLRTADSFIIIC